MRELTILAAVLGATACNGGSGGAREPVVFRGACDASGAVPLSERRVVVADDEDNILRVYDAEVGGAPLRQADLSPAVGVPLEGKKRPRPAEMDLEAATRIGDRAYWLTSHGRNKKGEREPARLYLFATSTLGDDDAFTLVGRPYERLVDDLIQSPAYARFGLAAAAELPPKAPGGLNIEGMTAGPDGELFLALRSPVPEGRALLVPLLNIDELVDPAAGGPARFGEPVLLDLGGRGVRSMSWWHGRYLLIAGAAASGGTSELYTWDGRGPAHAAAGVDLTGYNPEGFFTPEDRDELLVLSDDGERIIDGKPCKKLKDASRKQFRGVWVRMK